MDKIILMGYMGAGKSTIGKILAQKIKFKFVDLDKVIEKNENLSVNEIFNLKGELYFRKIENAILKEVLNSEENQIISLGGGTPCYSNNIDLFKKDNFKTIYLNRSVENLVENLKGKKDKRPLLKNMDDLQLLEYISKHLFERSFYYNQSQIIINSDNKSKEEITDEIIQKIQL
jgi:shikimate kinase